MDLLPDAFALLRPWLDSLTRGVLLFNVAGQGAYANPRAQSWLGPAALTAELSQLTQALVDAGFAVDEARTALWTRDGEGLLVSVESHPGKGTLVWLDEASPDAQQRLRFLSVASHDIRGALANARSFSSLLLHPKWNLDEKVRHGLQVVVRNVDRGLLLSHEVLDSLRAEAAPLDADISEIPLRQLVDGVLERARTAGAQSEVGVEVELNAASLPAAWPTDAARLAHVLDALFEHALERTPAHGVCRLQIIADSDSVTFAVTDEGSASDLPPDLFDRDRRVAEARKLDGGFRLPLAREEARAIGAALEAQVQPTGALRLTLILRRETAQLVAGVATPHF